MTSISEAISPTIPDDTDPEDLRIAAAALFSARDTTWETEDRDLRCDDLAARLGEHGIGVRGEL